MIENDEDFSATEYLADSLADLSWTADGVMLALDELATAHWEDCGEELRGFAAAYHGLHIAKAADEVDLDEDERSRRVLHHIGQLAAYMCGSADTDEFRATFSAISKLTVQWRWLGSPGCIQFAQIPGYSDTTSTAIN